MDTGQTLVFMAQILLVGSAIVFALSALDDLFFDTCFYLGRLWRRNPPPKLNIPSDNSPWFAIMVPAWDESEVLFNAVANMVATLDYPRYHIFVGTYPNDPASCEVAERLARQFTNVHKVLTQNDGPTCKADCLNHIVERLWVFEKRHNIEFSAAILQDAEDVLHPQLLQHFSRFIPGHDIVQVPVYSLPRPWHALTAGHYMDEFAESHSKDLFTRAAFTDVVPGAGVGTAYSRKALMAAAKTGAAFNTDSLTEDYEFSLRLRHAGLKQTFARSLASDASKHSGPERFIATREFFPSQFSAAVRQKTRWTLGIAFQGWEHFGWRDNATMHYLFWRDRKVIPLAIASLAGFASLFLLISAQLVSTPINGQALPPLLNEGNPVWWLICLNLFSMASRLTQRHFWSWRVYGVSVLPMLTLRYFWSGVINQLAALRSLWLFARHKWSGTALGWDKTTHDFPALEGLEELGHRLGESLVGTGLISTQQLNQALTTQRLHGGQLGRILMEHNFITEEQLMDTLGKKYRLQTEDIDPFQIAPEMYRTLPYEMLRRHQVIPVRWDDSTLELATAKILDTDAQEEIEAYLGKPVRLLLVTQASLFFALHTFSRLSQDKPNTSAQFNTRLLKSVAEQPRQALNSASVAAYLPFGQYLVKSGHLSPRALDEALANAADADKTLGQYLVEQGVLSDEERNHIVLKIENQYRSIMESYLEQLGAEPPENKKIA